MKKILFLLLDGLGDETYRELGGKTPLEYASTPNMDRLAFNGYCGKLIPLGLRREIPLSDASLMTYANLGYDVRKIKPSRGVVEAMGAGMKIKDGNLCARTNFAVVDRNWKIKDLRAGRIKRTKKLENRINKIKFPIPFRFKSTKDHRGVLVFYGKFSEKITNPDPHNVGMKVRRSSRMINDFMKEVYFALNGEKANFLLLRGFGSKLPKVKKFGKRAAAMIQKDDVCLDKGVARSLGMHIIETRRISKKELASAFKRHDFVFLPYKSTDLPGHDGNVMEKVRQIELADKFIGSLDLKDKTVVVTSDHCTVCRKKSHTTDPIPTLVSFGKLAGERKFGERYCKDFSIPSYKLIEYIKKLV